MTVNYSVLKNTFRQFNTIKDCFVVHRSVANGQKRKKEVLHIEFYVMKHQVVSTQNPEKQKYFSDLLNEINKMPRRD